MQDINVTPNRQTKRVLIITAEPDVNLALKMALEQTEGVYYFKVDCFNSPALALENLKKSLYDLLIVDIIMPQINGFDLAEEVKKIDDNARVCFLIAGEVPGKLRFTLETYKDKFIKLPIENNDLVTHVSTVIGS